MSLKCTLNDSKPFSQGRFRYAYKGTWTAHPTKKDQYCVVKQFKDTYIWEESGWDTTVKMYSIAREQASKFGNRLEYTTCDVMKCTEAVKHGGIKLNEKVVVEDYLEGDFTKWCNNYGYVSHEARSVDHILPAFMHWSWIYSKGEEMIGDIQGVKTPNGGYRLTDPAIMSITNQYGATDTGVEGMAMFFLTHKCTGACSHLPKPTLAQFVGKIPDHMLQAAIELQNFSKRGTTYTHEMKFTDDVKAAVITAFKTIARSK